jgi:hypothetical protein
MQQLVPQNEKGLRRLIRRLDPLLGHMNAVLLTVAVGLAVLDITCYAALSLVDAPFSAAEAGPETAKLRPLHSGGAHSNQVSSSTSSEETSP